MFKALMKFFSSATNTNEILEEDINPSVVETINTLLNAHKKLWDDYYACQDDNFFSLRPNDALNYCNELSATIQIRHYAPGLSNNNNTYNEIVKNCYIRLYNLRLTKIEEKFLVEKLKTLYAWRDEMDKNDMRFMQKEMKKLQNIQ